MKETTGLEDEVRDFIIAINGWLIEIMQSSPAGNGSVVELRPMNPKVMAQSLVRAYTWVWGLIPSVGGDMQEAGGQ